MATYDSLHISGGMGVQDENLKAERRDGLSVCIGLGGTGKDAIKQLKKAVYKNLKPDDLNSPIPTYRNIKFLVVDTDSLDPDLCRNVYGIDPASEFFSISSSDIAATFRSHNIMGARKELSWLNHENISVPDYIYGAGGIRQAGRFCLIDKAGQFKEKLTSLIQDGAGDPPDTINVHIFSGLSGGTGGGIFIDVCYIVRHVLEELGRDNALINGCFFLPDVNLSMPGVILHDPFFSKFKFIRSNGYAALKELDYLMDLERNRDRFVQNYGSFEINTNRMPVDCCNLISGTGRNGAIMENGHGYDYALHTAVDYVISVLAKSDFSPNFVGAGVLSPDRKHGAVYKYNFLGIIHAEVPLTDITTYLGSKLFLQFHDLLNPVPSEKDLENFVSANNIAFDQLLKQLTKGITYSIPYPASINKANDIIPGDKRVINCADTWRADAMGTLEENCRSMGEGLKQYDIPTHPSSLIARIFSSLIGIALDPSKGPVFAARLLGGQNNKNLLHIIDYYFGNNQERISAELRQEPLRKEELTAAEKNLAKASFISKRRHICEYLEALNNWYIHLAIIEKHNAMRSLLSVFKEQVHKLYCEFFRPLTTVFETLDNTFRKNDQRLSHEALNRRWPSFQEPLSWPIPILGNLQSHLDSIISGLDPASEAQNLVQHLLDNWRSWIIQDENKITRLISRYITQKFASVTHNDMEYWTNFLQITLPDVIQALMRQAAKPMPGDLFPLSDSQKSNYLLVPAPYIGLGVSAARAANEPYEACSQDMNNRMTVIKVYHNLPLYAWWGLAKLEKAYESGEAVPGRHLYEVGAVDWREILPSPYPASSQTDGHPSPRITEHREKLTKELEEAKMEGIVHCDSENHIWHIKQSKTADLPSLSEEVHDFLTNGKWDMEKLCDLLEHIREVREHMYADGNAEEITLTAQDAENGQEEIVLSDDYLRSPAIQRTVREELEKLHSLDREIEELEKSYNSFPACAPNRSQYFFDAVFTGVIRLGRNRILFSYEKFGMEQTLDLQTPSMPYGTKAPLYQAYLTYNELDSDMLDRIAEKTNDAIDNMTDEIYAVAKEVQARYSSDFLKMTVSRVAADPKKEEIQNFYKEFVMALQEYIITYM